MEPELVTQARLLHVLQEFKQREPLLHRRELVTDREDFERETADDFWETGASGRRYSREFVWATLKERFDSSDVDDLEREQWQTRRLPAARDRPVDLPADVHVMGPGRPADPSVDRVEGSIENGWKTLYHQGTVVE